MDLLAIRDAVVSHHEDFLAALEDMVNVDCGSFSREGVNAIADRCQDRFARGGWAVERTPHESSAGGPRLGDLVVGTLRGSGGPSFLLIGHMDTVFDEGTVAERPFRLEGDRAFGPGVSDMKGGLLTGFHAVEVLQSVGFDGFDRVTFVCNPDEEIGSPFSGPMIRELASQHDAAFVLEGGRENGDFVSARKGITDITVTVHGRAAHAGVEPERGRSAVVQAAHSVIALHALNGRWPGVTVNIGELRGGTRSNVVPERCVLEVDVRSPQAATLDEAEREVERICSETVVPDVQVEVDVHGWHRPMEKTAASARLVDLAIAAAAELGFDLRDASTGGASDANTTSAAGTPTIDGLGPVGGDDHAPGEWIDVTSIVPRISLLAGLMTRA